ncbi:MAG: signal peptidase I [Chitinispirillia bacterium]|jgi:signal peptidase I
MSINGQKITGSKIFFEIPLILIGSFIAFWLFHHYIISTAITSGQSMTPSLQSGDIHILNKWIYYFRNPKPGEIVVVKIPGDADLKVKRVIGVENDEITIKNNILYVNKRRLFEPYLMPNTITSAGFSKIKTFKIKEKHYFVLGDNREMSYDSRFFGSVHKRCIVGKLIN